jgi:hypothetical protein
VTLLDVSEEPGEERTYKPPPLKDALLPCGEGSKGGTCCFKWLAVWGRMSRPRKVGGRVALTTASPLHACASGRACTHVRGMARPLA